MIVARIAISLMLVAGVSTQAFALKASKARPTLRDQEQAACAGDARRLCRDDIPNEEKIEACMRAKFAQVSAGCKAFFH